MNTENKMKQIVIIAGVVIIFLLAAPYLYKVLLYGAGWVIWGFMAYFVGGVPYKNIKILFTMNKYYKGVRRVTLTFNKHTG